MQPPGMGYYFKLEVGFSFLHFSDSCAMHASSLDSLQWRGCMVVKESLSLTLVHSLYIQTLKKDLNLLLNS